MDLNEREPAQKRGVVVFSLQNMSRAAAYDIPAVWCNLDIGKMQTITVTPEWQNRVYL